jgi:hypothetical protein
VVQRQNGGVSFVAGCDGRRSREQQHQWRRVRRDSVRPCGDIYVPLRLDQSLRCSLYSTSPVLFNESERTL